tara:strand:+ start:568 stop:1755 length:1188 start_codon:yes stop_codon:yes gene_type:complete
MKIYVFEDQQALNFAPISSTRAVFDIRIGSETFLDRICSLFPNESISLIVRDELADLVSEVHENHEVNPEDYEDGLWISGSVIWSEKSIKSLFQEDTVFRSKNKLVAANLSLNHAKNWIAKGGPLQSDFKETESQEIEILSCEYLWDIIDQIPETINYDAARLSPINPKDYEHINLLNPKNIYIDNASIMPGALINAENGAVIIDSGVSIYGQTYIEGPAFIGANTIINPLTKIKKAIIGQKCKIGGELDSSIIQGYTNKVHDGHLGNSFLGEWVNLGAGTTNSNLKNNYSPIKVHINDELVNSKSLHVGCFVGDHVKTAIGTLINTGSVIGTASMIASYGFIPKTLPPFSWYINKKHQRIDIDKFILTAEIVKKRRNKNFSRIEKELYKKIANS